MTRALLGRLLRKTELTPLGNRNLLAPCENVWGEHDTFAADPTIESYKDVVFMPCTPNIGLRNDPNWGIYDATGNLIDVAALKIGAGFGLVGQSPHLDQVRDVEADHVSGQNYVYGGSINAHYGHFLCSSLARLWWLARSRVGDGRLVFHSPGELRMDWKLDFVATCFERLGLSLDNCSVVEKPTRFDELLIPAPAFIEQTAVHMVYKDICHDIGRAYWDSGRRMASLPPAYISKTKLGSGVGRLTNEKIIEDVMASRGAEIIYPETLSFGDQIRLFSQKRTIAGVVGSAFHTAIFAPPRSKTVCLVPNRQINSNMTLMDKVNASNVAYYMPLTTITNTADELGFGNSTNIENIEEIAAELARIVFDIKHVNS